MQKKTNLKNSHCEEAVGRRGNLLPPAVKEPFIFLGGAQSRCFPIGTAISYHSNDRARLLLA